MGGVADRAREVVSLLEAGALDDALGQVAKEPRGAMQPGVLSQWGSAIEGAIGGRRSIVVSEEIDGSIARVLLRGERGTLAVTVGFDDEDRVTELGVGFWVEDGVRNIVIGCPATPEAASRLADFYAAVLGMRVVRRDWLKVGKDLVTFPHLAFGDGWEDGRPPRWGDPDYPHQAHLEVEVADLEAGVAHAKEAGGAVLERSGSHVVMADPFGHPVYLRTASSGAAPAGNEMGRLSAFVLQCDDPDELARFWGGLLGLRELGERSADRVATGSSQERMKLAFERVEGYVPPRWHDPNFPEQIHLDLHFVDPEGACRRAEELGATLLPPPRGSCPVYADPAGHPFCICSPEGGETASYAAFIGAAR